MDDHSYIFGTSAKQLDETKEVKVKLPVGILIKLHGLKLLKGQNISDTVTTALERYFHADAQPVAAPEAVVTS